MNTETIRKLRDLNVKNLSIDFVIPLHKNDNDVDIKATIEIRTWAYNRWKRHSFNIEGSTIEEIIKEAEDINKLPFVN